MSSEITLYKRGTEKKGARLLKPQYVNGWLNENRRRFDF